ncbi:HDOD domain-containing protein [Paludibaculum fermentans]|uniref:HDOD domain-containing protein n=1 Tax=Paludibaculum fermentans TaxID=1473598 RepID=A0A7S7NTM2_PALFE|nr:HDOD domain-containing protein [Paludibaculum fermentans]QOY89596.1 HDOD domain-containing protein [Paludibaculum fermentans]
MSKKTVLFVDDELNVLEGLRTRLHRQRGKWEMVFVQSGREALERLAIGDVDVLVTDMRMPEMDGVTLLKRAQEEYPRVVRIVLSGHAELEAALRAIHVAHQFLSKPCEPGVIENVVERACNLQSLLHNEVLEKTVGRIENLPSPPVIYSQLMVALNNEFASPITVASILKQDMAMCAKTLQLVNSAFFGFTHKITEVQDAVTYLGYNTIRQIVLTVEVFHRPKSKTIPAITLEALQTHAGLVGALASNLLTDKRDKEDAFISGLLHDIGKLVVATEMPEENKKLQMLALKPELTSLEAEKQVLGVTHAEIGGYLLGLWGLPYSVVEAVANHHTPANVEIPGLSVLAAIHVADALLHEEMRIRRPSSKPHRSLLDYAFIEQQGLTKSLPIWRDKARQQMDLGARGMSKALS